MSKPASFAEFGAPVPSAPVACTTGAATRTRQVGRFSDVRAFVNGSMPEVRKGQIYADMDPRCRGRQVHVLDITADHRVMVRTLIPRNCEPRTPSNERRETTGTVSFIALRRFKPGARGFRLITSTSHRQVNAYLLACQLAAMSGIEVTQMETRTADALIALLGHRNASEYLDLLNEEPHYRTFYLRRGTAALIDDALHWASEEGIGMQEASEIHVAPKATAATVAARR